MVSMKEDFTGFIFSFKLADNYAKVLHQLQVINKFRQKMFISIPLPVLAGNT
jgi:hypothetical protein